MIKRNFYKTFCDLGRHEASYVKTVGAEIDYEGKPYVWQGNICSDCELEIFFNTPVLERNMRLRAEAAQGLEHKLDEAKEELKLIASIVSEVNSKR